MRYYGYDHFSKCVEEAKCFIYTSKHKGSKHKYSIKSYRKRLEPCKDFATKYANY